MKDIVLRRNYSVDDRRCYAICKGLGADDYLESRVKGPLQRFSRLDLTQLEDAPFQLVQVEEEVK